MPTNNAINEITSKILPISNTNCPAVIRIRMHTAVIPPLHVHLHPIQPQPLPGLVCAWSFAFSVVLRVYRALIFQINKQPQRNWSASYHTAAVSKVSAASTGGLQKFAGNLSCLSPVRMIQSLLCQFSTTWLMLWFFLHQYYCCISINNTTIDLLW